MSNIKIAVAGKTDVGKVREGNEDSLLVDESLGLFIVADGMGGHQAGEVASRMAVELVHENLKKFVAGSFKPENYNDKLSLKTNQLAFCAQMANQMIYEAAKQYPQDKGMGTTFSAALMHDGGMSIAHIGDSRIYVFRNNRLEQITQDHSLVMDQVRKGILKKEEAEKSKMANVLLRAMGTEAKAEIDAEEHPLMDGDMVLLCSDGLMKMLPDPEIETIIRTAKVPGAIAETLVEAANAAGGRDNITVILAQVQSAGGMLQNLKSKLMGGHHG